MTKCTNNKKEMRLFSKQNMTGYRINLDIPNFARTQRANNYKTFDGTSNVKLKKHTHTYKIETKAQSAMPRSLSTGFFPHSRN